MKWWPSKSHLSFCLFLVWENALSFQKHWKVTNFHVLWKLANMSVFSTRQSSAWGFFWEASSLFLDQWVPWDVQDVYRHLLSSCIEAIIHLRVCLVISPGPNIRRFYPPQCCLWPITFSASSAPLRNSRPAILDEHQQRQCRVCCLSCLKRCMIPFGYR